MTLRILFCLLTAALSVQAQSLPFVAGGVLETGTGMLGQDRQGAGIVRITPFVGAWLSGIGYLRLGFSPWSYETKDAEGNRTEWKQRDFTVQAGFALGGPERPYIAATYVRARTLSRQGDTEWTEWGAGIGHRFRLSPLAALVAEIEHRWIPEHYDRLQNLDVSGTRLQLNLGLAVYFY
jgi:hypothetical protein